ncbi:18158_t:CDS:1, partial [Racocetra fulgida]
WKFILLTLNLQVTIPELVTYLKTHDSKSWSYTEFLTTYRDVILASTSASDEWTGLNGTWVRRFLREANLLSSINDGDIEKSEGDIEKR